MWVTITEDDFNRKMAGPETNALKTKVLAAGQANPLPEIIADVVNEVRGYVAVKNTLAAGATIPDKLESAALAIIRFRLATRLPVSTLLTDDRRTENKDALALLKMVAQGDYAIDEPEDVSEEVIGTPSPSMKKKCRRFTRRSQDGY